jgi:hypothetical protein
MLSCCHVNVPYVWWVSPLKYRNSAEKQVEREVTLRTIPCNSNGIECGDCAEKGHFDSDLGQIRREKEYTQKV